MGIRSLHLTHDAGNATDTSYQAPEGGAVLTPLSRGLSLVAGTTLTATGWRKLERFAIGAGLLAAGGYLVYRGVTGRCPLLGRALARRRGPTVGADVGADPPDSDMDAHADEASLESFPASDPPAWTH